MTIILIGLCIAYLLGILFTLCVLLYVDNKSKYIKGLTIPELNNKTIIISSIFWISYWKKYYELSKAMKDLEKFYKEIYKMMKDEEDKKNEI